MITGNMKTLLTHLLNHGYTYLAKDPCDNSLYAYKTKPYLEEDFYTLSNEQLEEPYAVLSMNARGIDMFIKDHNLTDLYGVNVKAMSLLEIDTKEPVAIKSLFE